MPTAEEILSGLSNISNTYIFFAIAWHVVFLLLFALLYGGWKPSGRRMTMLLCLPLLSVGIFSLLQGNSFNGTLFVVSALALLLVGLKADNDPILIGKPREAITGFLLIIFGLLYPEFLNTNSGIEYLYAAPTGLIPCPTLSIVIGFTLVYNGFKSRNWSILIAALGIFYGFFGVFRLGVTLDIILLSGALVLLISVFSPKRMVGVV